MRLQVSSSLETYDEIGVIFEWELFSFVIRKPDKM